MKKLTVMLLIAAMVLGVSACGNSANKENTATESQMSTQEAEDLDAKINELTQKENCNSWTGCGKDRSNL